MKWLKDLMTKSWCKFKNAFRGLKYALQYDPSIILQLVIAFVVVMFGVIIKLTETEWIWVSSGIALVLVSEFLNSAIEDACDLFTKDFHWQVKRIKDIGAAAVLIASIYALFVAIIIVKGRIL